MPRGTDIARGRHVAVAGHFGEWLQGRMGHGGPVAVVSLPCPVLRVRGRAWPSTGLRLHVAGPRVLGPTQLRQLIAGLGLRPRGRFALQLEMPLGGGAGASTASLVALARLAGAPPGAPLARACLDVEGATDPLMWPHGDEMLWAPRTAQILGRLPPLPRCEILGGFFGPSQRTDPKDIDFPDIAPLVADWRAAAGDLPRLATLASASAQATRAHRGLPTDPLSDLARRLGALGQVIAHTGSARGLIFAPGTVPPQGPAALREAGLTGIVRFRTGRI